MRVIVAGGRDFGYRFLENGERDKEWMIKCKNQMFGALDRLFADYADEYLMPVKDLVIVSGAAPGADTLGEDWAVVNWVPIKQYPADWDKIGRAAGVLRNQEMADNADALVAFWNGKSTGTKDMITRAMKKGLEVHVYRYESK